MSEQEENELICEKLLGWTAWQEPGKALQWKQLFDDGRGWTINDTPSFTDWASAGLILDWLMTNIGPELEHVRDEVAFSIRHRKLTPLAVRSAALAYLREGK